MYAVIGNTFRNKEILKQIGKWDAVRKAWIVDEKGRKRVEQACFSALRDGSIRIVDADAASPRPAARRPSQTRGGFGAMYAHEKRDLGLPDDFDD